VNQWLGVRSVVVDDRVLLEKELGIALDSDEYVVVDVIVARSSCSYLVLGDGYASLNSGVGCSQINEVVLSH
jgi:hypothetical protein